jgi:Concanavalin A-like lectin/glucanases superfamily/F5/8 type C domain
MEAKKLTSLVCALAAGLIANLANADITTDLVGYWKLDDGAGTTAIDSSGNGNHGTLMGSPEWTTGGEDVKVGGGALYFDYVTGGASDYVDCGDKPEFDITDNITLALWVKCDGFTASYQYFFSKDTGSGGYSIIRNAQTRNCRVVFNGLSGQYYATGSTVIDDGQWHHLAASYDNSTGVVAFYTDGLLEVAEAASGDLSTNDLSLHIGGRDVRNSNAFIDDTRIYNRTLSADDIMELFLYKGNDEAATIVAPGKGAIDVARDVILSWRPGEFSATHDVYLGTTFDDVNEGSTAVLVSQGQDANSYDAGVLAFGQTYYWRVDEVNGAPDNAIFKGDTWSFTVEPLAYPIANVTATSNVQTLPGSGPENTVNGSGLNENDEHSIDGEDMWQATPAGDELLYIEYEFDGVYKLHQMLVWNYNVQFELLLGFGVKNVTVEYSEDGTTWMSLGDVELAQATAKADYTANTAVDMAGVAAQYVKITVNSGYGTMGQYGLSEVRFMSIPVHAREPQPTDGATDVSVDTMLGWRAGREAVSHEVYFGTDAEALPLVDTVDGPGYEPGILDLATTYYWKVDEVNDAEAIGAWEGHLWSFTTETFFVVDDFEGYNDEDNLIYESWIDGWVNETGSTVGYLEAPFAERTIVNSGRQSMPLFYDNTGVATSEAELALGQNWTTNGIQGLSLSFYGDPDNTGQLYVKINDTKIAYEGDAADIASAAWQVWNIDLSTVGGNLSNVASLTIGIEGAGAAGVVYIDDIRLVSPAP